MRPAVMVLFAAAACGPSTTELRGEPPESTATATATVPPTASATSEVATSATASVAPAASSSAPATTAAAPVPVRDLVDLTTAPELAEAAGHIRAKEWSKAAKSLEAAKTALGKSGKADDWIVLHALLGRTRAALGDMKKAADAYEVVLKTYRGKETLDSLGPPGDPTTIARTRLVIEAVSEARFFQAEQKRIAMEKASKRPTYRGDGSKDDVTKFLTGPFATWMKERRVAMQEVEKEYLAVVSVEPVPSPAFVVRAAERVGAMWSTHVRDVRGAPMPKEWQGEGSIGSLPKAEIRAAYERAMNDATEPWLQQARAAYRHCVDKAQRFQITSEAATACAKWLEENPAPK